MPERSLNRSTAKTILCRLDEMSARAGYTTVARLADVTHRRLPQHKWTLGVHRVVRCTNGVEGVRVGRI